MIGVPAHFGNSIYKKLAFVVNFFFFCGRDENIFQQKKADFGKLFRR